MKALELLKADRDYCKAINNDKSIINQYDEAIKELEDLQKDMHISTDDRRTLKDFVFTNCNECINKVDNNIKQISITNSKLIHYSFNNTDYFYNENENLFYDNLGNKYNDEITDRFKKEVEQYIINREDYYRYISAYKSQIKLLNNMLTLNEVFNFNFTWVNIHDLLMYLDSLKSDSLKNKIIYLYLYKAYHKDNSFEIIEKKRIIKVEFYDSIIEIIPPEDVKDLDNISLLKWFKQNYIIEDITNPFI